MKLAAWSYLPFLGNGSKYITPNNPYNNKNRYTFCGCINSYLYICSNVHLSLESITTSFKSISNRDFVIILRPFITFSNGKYCEIF